MSGDDRDERPRPSWSEIDKRRDKPRPRDVEARGPGSQERAARATRRALEEADSLFHLEHGGAEGERLAKAVRDAHGSPGLADACRAYCDAVGLPAEPSLLQLFLDSGERELIVAALEGLLAIKNAGSLDLASGLKSQLRVLAQDRDDDIAGISEELLE